MKYIEETEIKRIVHEIETMRVGAMTHPRTPICLILDYSGSMNSYKKEADLILDKIAYHMQGVGHRYFTLIIILIYNSECHVAYFGDLTHFDAKAFIASLPKECYGQTPLARSVDMTDEYLNWINEACNKSGQICTIPFYFIVTDALTTESPEEYKRILTRLSSDIMYNRKIIIECVLTRNKDALDFGVYKVSIDSEDRQKVIENCMKALRYASSTEADVKNGVFSTITKPPKSNRKAYSEYLSSILASNMMFFFSQFND